MSHTGLVQPPERNREKRRGPYSQQDGNCFQHDELSSARERKDTHGRELVIKGRTAACDRGEAHILVRGEYAPAVASRAGQQPTATRGGNSDETARIDMIAEAIDGRQSRRSNERRNPISLLEKHSIDEHDDCLDPRTS